jgi:hypothetical protein
VEQKDQQNVKIKEQKDSVKKEVQHRRQVVHEQDTQPGK